MVVSHVHVTLVLLVMVLSHVMMLMNVKTILICATQMQLAVIAAVAIVANVMLVGLVMAKFVQISMNALPIHTIVMPMHHVLIMMEDSAVSATLDLMISKGTEQTVEIGMNAKAKEVATTVTNGPFVRIWMVAFLVCADPDLPELVPSVPI